MCVRTTRLAQLDATRRDAVSVRGQYNVYASTNVYLYDIVCVCLLFIALFILRAPVSLFRRLRFYEKRRKPMYYYLFFLFSARRTRRKKNVRKPNLYT